MARNRAAAALAAVGLVAPLAFAAPAFAATSTDAIPAGLTKVNLLNINDFHGRIDDKGALACTVETAKATLGEGSTMFFSAGDNVGASPFVSSVAEDNPTIGYLSALELKASSVGNHEFDRGFADLTGRIVPAAGWDYLGANVYERGTTKPALKEYSIQEVNGVKVGIIGAVTAETASLVGPSGITGIEFGDPVDAVNRVAAQLSDGDQLNGEADIIVAEYHNGASGGATLADSLASTTAFADMVNKTAASVDVIFNGHTHMTYAYDAPIPGGEGTRPVVQAGQYGEKLAQVELGYDAATGKVAAYRAQVNPVNKTVSDACLTDAQYVAARQVADAAIAHAKEVGQQKVGEITADITTAMKDAALTDGYYVGTARDDRLRESTLGNLTAQIWLEAMKAPGRPGADIGIMNPGGLRAELYYKSSGQPGDADGVVTLAEAAAVNPFANTLQTIDITGAQFKTLLEQQWQPEGSSRPFLKLGLSSNVRYTYDPTRAAGDRVTSITYDGMPMDPAATFRIASGSFLIGGGDNFTVLQQGTNIKDSGLIDTDAFMNYFSAKSPVSPSFEKNGVAVLKASATTKELTIRMEGFDLTSQMAPANKAFDVLVDGTKVGTFDATSTVFTEPLPTRNGEWEYVVPVSLKAGAATVTLVSTNTGTTVTVPVTVTKADKAKGPWKGCNPKAKGCIKNHG